ncbi:unnamed protein product [[Actinomadura] parvosata subsp. kistnae]|uniref:TolB family protein n=1 Tax=[Actinomadura] parvosata TaxID=1955412 RepID=UPI000D2CE9DF|nr:unnamed protein product [Actinomadura parvosata subsp. kistnae]
MLKVPARTPDERGIRPILLLDGRTMLVTTWSSFEKTDAIYAYDLTTHDLRKITDVPTPKGTTLFAGDFTIGEGQVVWWTRLKRGPAQIWAAPLDGGQARAIGTQQTDGSGLDGVEVSGGRVAFSARADGIYSLPLAGGRPEPVEGGAPMHLLRWPWIGTPGRFSHGSTTFTEIRNVETGQTSEAMIRDGERFMSCDVDICWSGREDRAFYRLRDGSDKRPLPGNVSRMGQIARNRFHVSSLIDRTRTGIDQFVAAALYDLPTGRVGDLGVRPRKNGEGFSCDRPGFDRTGRLLAYSIGEQMYVIDLDKL